MSENKENQKEEQTQEPVTQSNEEELQKKYMEYQMIEQQVKATQEQLEKFEQQLQELDGVKTALTDIKNSKEGTETLVPLSSGIFIFASLANTKKCKVNVGAGVCVEKSIDDTKALLEKQQTEIEKYREQVTQHLTMFAEQLQKAEKEMETLIKGIKNV
jgi:prefoldin alpha subunit